MKNTEYRDLTSLKHWKKMAGKYNRMLYRRPLTERERQELSLLESKIEAEYAKPCKPWTECNTGCNESEGLGLYDIDCSVHGWAQNLTGRK